MLLLVTSHVHIYKDKLCMGKDSELKESVELQSEIVSLKKHQAFVKYKITSWIYCIKNLT